MSFPKYPAYKDSGIEWIGEIPVGWDVLPLKRIFSLKNGATPKSGQSDFWDGEITWITPADLNSERPEIITHSKKTISVKGAESCAVSIVPKGSIIISTRAPIGSIGLAGTDLCTNQGCRSLVPDKGVSSKFFLYFFYSAVSELQILGKGTTFLELSSDNLASFLLCFPPLPEQQAIASFLDRECGKIDALIAEQQRLIALLAEKRQAVISHAVTKGLNPNAPMKDSGIPWIGMVPEGWDCSRLRFVAQFNPSKTEISYIPLNEEVSFLPMEAIGDDGTINLEQKRKISDVQNGYTYFRDMDIVFAKITPCFENGKGAVVKKLLRGIGFGTTELIVARSVPSRVIPEYLFRFFQSDIFRKPAEASMYGAGGQKRVSERFVRDFSVYLPPLPDQQAIASFLDLTCSKIDTLIAEQKTMLTLCKERRAALISAAVTGKIDVRAQSKAVAA